MYVLHGNTRTARLGRTAAGTHQKPSLFATTRTAGWFLQPSFRKLLPFSVFRICEIWESFQLALVSWRLNDLASGSHLIHWSNLGRLISISSIILPNAAVNAQKKKRVCVCLGEGGKNVKRKQVFGSISR